MLPLVIAEPTDAVLKLKFDSLILSPLDVAIAHHPT